MMRVLNSSRFSSPTGTRAWSTFEPTARKMMAMARHQIRPAIAQLRRYLAQYAMPAPKPKIGKESDITQSFRCQLEIFAEMEQSDQTQD